MTMNEALKSISEKWTNLSEDQKKEISKEFAGSRKAGELNVYMDNFNQ